MSWTVGDAISQAREIIQDIREPYRNSDQQLLGYYNHAIGEMRRLRPDLFLGNQEEGQLLAGITHATQVSDPIIVEEQYFSPLPLYIAAMVAVSDDEFVNNGRAAGLMAHFKAQLVGTRATS